MGVDRWKKLQGLALALYTAVVLIVTHWSAERLPHISLYGGDKLAHLGAYGVWGVLAGYALAPPFIRWLVAGLLLAAVDEYTQPLFNRHADWYDWWADVAGICLGLLGAWHMKRRSRA